MASWRSLARGLSAVLPWPLSGGGAAPRQLFVSSIRTGPRRHALILIDEHGAEAGRVPLEGRGHDIAVDAVHRRVAVFARRPGYFALVVDIDSLTPLASLVPPEGHHFFGHGVFAADGRLLYATENDFAGERPRAVIGVYDATGGFARIGEFPTHGLDAHEILLDTDGRTLVVANGGIETHPDFGRQKLNLSEMRPSIVRIDSLTGDQTAETVLPASLNRLSMRHMTIAGDGAVWFGCQWEGEKTARPPLVGRLDRDGEATLLPFPDEIAPLARNYIGSVVASRDGSAVAASSPVGGTIFVWDVASRSLRKSLPLHDGCGLSSPEGDRFLATTGDGGILTINGDGTSGPTPAVTHGLAQFDNHMRRV